MNTRITRIILTVTAAAIGFGAATVWIKRAESVVGRSGATAAARSADGAEPKPPVPNSNSGDLLGALFKGMFGDPQDQAVGAAQALFADIAGMDETDFTVKVYCVPGSKVTRQQVVDKFGEGAHPPYTVAMPDAASLKSKVVAAVPADAVLHYGVLSLAFDKTGCLRAIVDVCRPFATDAPAERRELAKVITDVTPYLPTPNADSGGKQPATLERWVLDTDIERREDNPRPKWVLPLGAARATSAPPVSRRVLQRPALPGVGSSRTAPPAPPSAKEKKGPPPPAPTDPMAALKALAAGELTSQDDPAAVAARVLLSMLAGKDTQAGNAIAVPAETLTLTYVNVINRFGASDEAHRTVQMHERVPAGPQDAAATAGGRRRLDLEPRPGGFQGTPARANLHYGPLTLAFDQDYLLHTLVWVNDMPEANAAGHAEETVVIVRAVKDGKPDIGIDFHASPHWLIAY